MADGVDLEEDHVEQTGLQRRKVLSSVAAISLLNHQRDASLNQDPSMHLPVGEVLDLGGFGEDGDLFVVVVGVDAEQLVEPVVNGP